MNVIGMVRGGFGVSPEQWRVAVEAKPTLREVDVVIKGSVGGQQVRICIECRDHKRVADVQWVEQMKAKHERLQTADSEMFSAGALVTRRGRTSAVAMVPKP